MEIILQAYNHNERVAQVVIDRAMYYFSLAICNTIQLLRPKQLVLYGTLFENTSFRKIVVKNLSSTLSLTRYLSAILLHGSRHWAGYRDDRLFL